MYEKGLTVRESGYGKTKKRVEDLSSTLEKQLLTGRDKVSTTIHNFADKYLPDAKERVDSIDRTLKESLDKLTDNLKKLLTDNVDQNIQKTFNYEKELLNKIKEIFQKNLTNYQTQVKKLIGGDANHDADKSTGTGKRKSPSTKKPTTIKKSSPTTTSQPQ